jgi:hypothetical protein
MNKIKTVKSTISLYRNIIFCFDHVSTQDLTDDVEYILLSEPLEVEFILKPNEEIVIAQVRSIDAAIEKETEEMLRKIDLLKGKKAELLALGGN